MKSSAILLISPLLLLLPCCKKDLQNSNRNQSSNAALPKRVTIQYLYQQKLYKIRYIDYDRSLAPGAVTVLQTDSIIDPGLSFTDKIVYKYNGANLAQIISRQIKLPFNAPPQPSAGYSNNFDIQFDPNGNTYGSSIAITNYRNFLASEIVDSRVLYVDPAKIGNKDFGYDVFRDNEELHVMEINREGDIDFVDEDPLDDFDLFPASLTNSMYVTAVAQHYSITKNRECQIFDCIMLGDPNYQDSIIMIERKIDFQYDNNFDDLRATFGVNHPVIDNIWTRIAQFQTYRDETKQPFQLYQIFSAQSTDSIFTYQSYTNRKLYSTQKIQSTVQRDSEGRISKISQSNITGGPAMIFEFEY